MPRRRRLRAMNRLRLRAYALVFGAAMYLEDAALRLAQWAMLQQTKGCGCDRCPGEVQRPVSDLCLEWSGEVPAKRESRPN